MVSGVRDFSTEKSLVLGPSASQGSKNTFHLLPVLLFMNSLVECASMAWVIVGLGNPGEQYRSTRHNSGRMALEFFAREMKFREWKEDRLAKAHVASGFVGKTAVVLVAPNTYMNKSGAAVARFVKSQKAAERMVVVYDDLDLPIGKWKFSFNRGSGGHKGIESIARALKTKAFVRIRVGIAPTSLFGKTKKPKGDDAVIKFILGKFTNSELAELKKVSKEIGKGIETLLTHGLEKAMGEYNH